MFRTIAVLLLLLGLATATPVVCLCTPALAPGGTAFASGDRHDATATGGGLRAGQHVAAADLSMRLGTAAQPGTPMLPAGAMPVLGASLTADPTGTTTDAARLISTSAAAAVASIVATAAGLPSSAPWRLPRPGLLARLLLPAQSAPGGLAWAPVPPPPR